MNLLYKQIGDRKVFTPTPDSRAFHLWIFVGMVFSSCFFGAMAVDVQKIDSSISLLMWGITGIFVVLFLSISLAVELRRGYRVELEGENLTQIRTLFGKTFHSRTVCLNKGYRFSIAPQKGDTIKINVVVENIAILIAVVPVSDVVGTEAVLMAVLGREQVLDSNPIVPVTNKELDPTEQDAYFPVSLSFLGLILIIVLGISAQDFFFPKANVIRDDTDNTEVKCSNIRLYYPAYKGERSRMEGVASFSRLAGYPYAFVYGHNNYSLSMQWNIGCATKYNVSYDPYVVTDAYPPKLHIPVGSMVGVVLADGSTIAVPLHSDAKYRRQQNGGRGAKPTQEFLVYAHYTPEQYRQMISLGVDSFWVETEEGRIVCPLDPSSKSELKRKQSVVLNKTTQLSSLPRQRTEPFHPKMRSDL